MGCNKNTYISQNYRENGFCRLVYKEGLQEHLVYIKIKGKLFYVYYLTRGVKWPLVNSARKKSIGYII